MQFNSFPMPLPMLLLSGPGTRVVLTWKWRWDGYCFIGFVSSCGCNWLFRIISGCHCSYDYVDIKWVWIYYLAVLLYLAGLLCSFALVYLISLNFWLNCLRPAWIGLWLLADNFEIILAYLDYLDTMASLLQWDL